MKTDSKKKKKKVSTVTEAKTLALKVTREWQEKLRKINVNCEGCYDQLAKWGSGPCPICG
jgi:hypothetical protein